MQTYYVIASYLAAILDVRQSGSDKAGKNSLASRLETPERRPVEFLQYRQFAPQEVVERATWLAMEDHRSHYNQLIIDHDSHEGDEREADQGELFKEAGGLRP